jgi:hypothetical protein
MEEPADGEEQEVFTFNDVLSNDHEDPATRAARRLDWETLRLMRNVHCEETPMNTRCLPPFHEGMRNR